MARPVTNKVMEDQIWVRQRNGTWYCYARKRVWRDGKTVELERRLLGKADERGGELRPTRPKRKPAAKAGTAGAAGTDTVPAAGSKDLREQAEERDKRMQVTGAVVVMRKLGATDGEIVATVAEALDVTEAYTLAILDAQAT